MPSIGIVTCLLVFVRTSPYPAAALHHLRIASGDRRLSSYWRCSRSVAQLTLAAATPSGLPDDSLNARGACRAGHPGDCHLFRLHAPPRATPPPTRGGVAPICYLLCGIRQYGGVETAWQGGPLSPCHGARLIPHPVLHRLSVVMP